MSQKNGDLRSAILDADDIEYVPVKREVWGRSDLFVRMMDGTERERYEIHCLESKKKSISGVVEDIRASLVAWTLCGPDKKLIFDARDIPRLAKKSGVNLDIAFEVASEVNQLDSRYVEELAKNSEAGQAAGSSSDSA
jgi:hypothetical protein